LKTSFIFKIEKLNMKNYTLIFFYKNNNTSINNSHYTTLKNKILKLINKVIILLSFKYTQK